MVIIPFRGRSSVQCQTAEQHYTTGEEESRERVQLKPSENTSHTVRATLHWSYLLQVCASLLPRLSCEAGLSLDGVHGGMVMLHHLWDMVGGTLIMSVRHHENWGPLYLTTLLSISMESKAKSTMQMTVFCIMTLYNTGCGDSMKLVHSDSNITRSFCRSHTLCM